MIIYIDVYFIGNNWGIQNNGYNEMENARLKF